MRIERVHVSRYGPMAPFDGDAFGRFCVIHGPNERGKTLLIDAVMRLLFKSELKKAHIRRFGNMGRVEEPPEGFVVLDVDGRERKLESGDTLTEATGVTLTPEDFRNVFVVRDSDFSTHESKQYYAGVTERLTGVRTREIDALIRTVQRLGRLRSASADSGLSNRAEDGKLADTVAAARALVGEIGEERARLVEEGYDRLEGELVAVKREIQRLEKEKRRLDATATKRKLMDASDVLRELTAVEKARRGLAHLEDSEAARWQALSVSLEREEQDLFKERSEVDKLHSERKSAEQELKRLSARLDHEQERLRQTESAIGASLDALEAARSRAAAGRGAVGLNRRAMWALAAVSAVSMAGYAVAPGVLPALIAAGALLGAGAFYVAVRRYHKAVGEVDAVAARVAHDARRHGVTADSLEAVVSSLERKREEVRSLEDEQREARSSLDVAVAQIARGEERVRGMLERTEKIEAEVASLETRSGMASLEEYQKAVAYRRDLTASINAKRELLCGLIGEPDSAGDSLAAWRERIDRELRRYESVPVTDTDAGADDRLQTELEERKALESDIDEKLRAGKARLHSIEVRATEIGLLAETPPCRTTHELDNLARELSEACDDIARRQFVAQQAIALFLAIQAEEQEKVGELFGAGSPVSGVFSQITAGRYRAVHYDAAGDRVVVQRADGEAVDATALSGGAYDQLYLSIRLTIAEKLMGGKTGFFIMDDPFIKADRERLHTQMEMLRRVIARGWQVLYFTAKDEVLQELREDIVAGRAKRFDLRRERSRAGGKPASVDPGDDPSQMPLFN